MATVVPVCKLPVEPSSTTKDPNVCYLPADAYSRPITPVYSLPADESSLAKSALPTVEVQPCGHAHLYHNEESSSEPFTTKRADVTICRLPAESSVTKTMDPICRFPTGSTIIKTVDPICGYQTNRPDETSFDETSTTTVKMWTCGQPYLHKDDERAHTCGQPYLHKDNEKPRTCGQPYMNKKYEKSEIAAVQPTYRFTEEVTDEQSAATMQMTSRVVLEPLTASSHDRNPFGGESISPTPSAPWVVCHADESKSTTTLAGSICNFPVGITSLSATKLEGFYDMQKQELKLAAEIDIDAKNIGFTRLSWEGALRFKLMGWLDSETKPKTRRFEQTFSIPRLETVIIIEWENPDGVVIDVHVTGDLINPNEPVKMNTLPSIVTDINAVFPTASRKITVLCKEAFQISLPAELPRFGEIIPTFDQSFLALQNASIIDGDYVELPS